MFRRWSLYTHAVLFRQLLILPAHWFNFAPSVTGDFIPNHRWLYLPLVFSETLEIPEAPHLSFSYLIKAFLEFIILFYFSKQKNFFLVGTADGKLAVFEDRAVKVDLFLLSILQNIRKATANSTFLSWSLFLIASLKLKIIFYCSLGGNAHVLQCLFKPIELRAGVYFSL